MRFSDFITDRREVLLACFAGGIVFTLLLVLFGLGTGELVLLWICFLLIIISAMLAIWRGESRRAHLLLSEMEKLVRSTCLRRSRMCRKTGWRKCISAF